MGVASTYWKKRDREVLQLVANWRYMSTDQVHHFMFRHIKNGQSKASDRLRALSIRQKLNRTRVGKQFIYHPADELGQKWQHWYELCNFYIKMEREKKSWEVLTLHPEITAGDLRPDALLIVKNTGVNPPTNEKYFIEIDRATNKMDKILNYNQLFEQTKAWNKMWWTDLNREGIARFPKIIIATVRPETVERHINRENRNNLNFRVEVL